MSKGLKLKVRKFLGLIATFVELIEEKLVGRIPPSWIGLNNLTKNNDLFDKTIIVYKKSWDVITYYIGQKASYDINSLQIVFYKINGYIEEDDDANENLYFVVIPDNKENKDMPKNIKKYEMKKYFICLRDNNKDDYNDNEYLKTKVKLRVIKGKYRLHFDT